MVEWIEKPIGDLLEFKNGLNKGKAYFGHGIPIINYMDVYKKDGIYCHEIHGRVDLTEQEIKRFEIRKGDVFFTRTSETPEEVGISCVLLDDVTNGVFSGFVLRGRPKTDELDIEYCKYCFQTAQVRKEIVSHCTYTTRALTNGTRLSKICIPIPPRREQRTIALMLSDAGSYITALEKLIMKKRSIKQGTMQDLLLGKRRLQGFCDEWGIRKIGEFAQVVSGGTPSTFHPEYWGGNIPWMNSGELNLKRVYAVEGRITEEGLSNSSTTKVPKHSILIGLAGQGKTRGTVAMNYFELCTNQSIAAVFPNESVYCSEYLYQNLDSRYDELRELSTGEGGRGGLNLTILRNLNIPFPSLDEQTHIATVLFDMDAEIKVLNAKLNKAKLIKQGMMEQLLTGKIRLEVMNDA